MAREIQKAELYRALMTALLHPDGIGIAIVDATMKMVYKAAKNWAGLASNRVLCSPMQK